jgi:hypothetical protein
VAEKKTDLDDVDNPDLWFVDTGATVHMTPYKNKLSNINKQDSSDIITMGNGSH